MAFSQAFSDTCPHPFYYFFRGGAADCLISRTSQEAPLSFPPHMAGRFLSQSETPHKLCFVFPVSVPVEHLSAP